MKNQINFQDIMDRAIDEAVNESRRITPQPMTVGGGSSNQTYFVEDGLCGFAWINLPKRGKFSNWLLENGYARVNSYGPGIRIWYSYLGLDTQSYERNKAGCYAAAKVFQEYGFKCEVDYRLD
jgi:hypothetical protein